ISQIGTAHDILVLDDMAIVAAGERGLRIFDVHDPSRPFEVDERMTSGEARGLAFANGLAHVAVSNQWSPENSHILIVDPRSPGLPVIGQVFVSGELLAVRRSSDRLHVARVHQGRLEIVSY